MGRRGFSLEEGPELGGAVLERVAAGRAAAVEEAAFHEICAQENEVGRDGAVPGQVDTDGVSLLVLAVMGKQVGKKGHKPFESLRSFQEL